MPTTALAPWRLMVMAAATGVIVANLYYVQPLLHQIRTDFRVSSAAAAALVTLTQAGYALGLVLVVPLGDLVARRPLLVVIFLAAAAVMAAAALVHRFALMAALAFVIGLVSVGAQTIVPLAADLAAPAQRGRTIARVMTGLLVGVLLSRTFAGLVAQGAGWRAVYAIAAGALGVAAAVLALTLPDEARRPRVRYRDLLVGTAALVRLGPLRRRALYGAVVFGAFSVAWTTLSFHLAGAPFHYSNAQIGLFGLFGVAGVTAANFAGHAADRHGTHWSSLTAASLVAGAFIVLALGGATLAGLAVGLVLLDAGMQGMQITNQSIIYALRPEARSRVNSVYMTFSFLGAAAGSLLAGQLYDRVGWTGDCWVGAGLGAVLVVPTLLEARAYRGRVRVS